MSEDVRIKQFEPEDEAPLLEYLRSAYPGEPLKSNAAFWRWHFLQNPYAEPGNVPLWVVREGARALGQMATIPVQLKVGGAEKRALWIIDFIISPELRGKGVGKGLMRVAREGYCTTMLALGYNKDSEAVLLSHKWRPMGTVNRYHLMLFPGHAAKEVSRLAPARHLANLVYAPFRPGRRELSHAGAGELREVETFDASFDELWQDASTQWPCAVVRNARFLEWQFRRQPGKRYDVLGYYDGGGRLRGYVVLFFRKAEGGGAPNKAAVSDICYSAEDPDAVVEALLRGALRLAVERRAGGLVVDVLDARVERQLARLGFWKIKAAPPFMVGTFEDEELMYDRSKWFLTRGDSDVSIFEEPNADF